MIAALVRHAHLEDNLSPNEADFVLARDRTTNFDLTSQIGKDDLIVSEFLAIERFMLDTVASDSNNEYTCTLDSPGDYEDNVYWLECADMASSSTLTNAFFQAPVLDGNGDPVTDDTGKVVSYNEFNRSALNHFGGEFLCEAEYSGEQARVGDGVIDTFDIAALLWYHFKYASYESNLDLTALLFPHFHPGNDSNQRRRSSSSDFPSR